MNQDAFLKEIDSIPEGGILTVTIKDKSLNNHAMCLQHGSLTKLSRLLDGRIGANSVCLVSMIDRPGSALFWNTLEHEWFSPLGSNEENYLCIYARWEGLLWVLGIIPSRLEWTFDEAARRTRMRVVKSPPALIRTEGISYFPVKQAYTLENDHAYTVSLRQEAEDLNRLYRDKVIKPENYNSSQE